MSWSLLYFDDQAQNIECYQMLLKDKFAVIGCQSSPDYRRYLEEVNPHAILIDVHMPELSGHELYHKIISDPAYNGCPVIFVSGDISDETKLRSYESGGVDFLTREMTAEEIEGRLVSKVKFFQRTASRLRVGNLVIDYDTMKVYLDGAQVDLTLIEMRILANVIRGLPDGISRQDLLSKVWSDENIKPGTINTHLTWIKGKLAGWNHTLQIRQETVLLKPKDQ